MFDMNTPILKLTDAAIKRIKSLMDQAPDDDIIGVRISVQPRGCSGFSYTVEYAKEQKKLEDVIESQGVRVFVDPTAVMFILGTEMDYEVTQLHSGFVFKNPNEKARCGCGESFMV